MKNIRFFILKFSVFEVKFSIYLNRRVFIMSIKTYVVGAQCNYVFLMYTDSMCLHGKIRKLLVCSSSLPIVMIIMIYSISHRKDTRNSYCIFCSTKDPLTNLTEGLKTKQYQKLRN